MALLKTTIWLLCTWAITGGCSSVAAQWSDSLFFPEWEDGRFGYPIPGESEETLLALSKQQYREHLQTYLDKPFALNEADLDELIDFPWVGPAQALALIRYREQYGPLLHWNEWMRIPGATTIQVRQLQSLCRLTYPKALPHKRNWRDWWQAGQTTFAMRWKMEWPPKAGIQNGNYPGMPFHYYHRVRRHNPGHYSIGWIAEHDAGEPRTTGLPFDFNTFHLHMQEQRGWLRSVTLGDFQVQHGQALLVAPAFSVFPGFGLDHLMRASSLVRPKTSANESRFFRGAALRLQHQQKKIIGWISATPFDGQISDDSLTISGENLSGLHRTNSEQQRRHNAHRMSSGLLLTQKNGALRWGCGIVYHRDRSPHAVHFPNHYAWALNLRYRLPHGLLFGETGGHFSGRSISWILGGMWALGNDMEWAWLHYHYSPHYNNPFAQPLAIRSKWPGIQGYRTALTYAPNPSQKWQLQADQARTAGSVNPTWARWQIGLQWSRQSSEWGEWRCRYTYRNTQEEQPDTRTGEWAYSLSRQNRVGIRWHYRVLKQWHFTLRWEWVGADSNTGQVIAWDAGWHSVDRQWQVDIRWALADTRDYATRIYLYERQLPYTFSIPVYYDQTWRQYAQVRWKFSLKGDLYLRWGQWIRPHTRTWGSGNDEQTGPVRTQLSCLLRWKI